MTNELTDFQKDDLYAEYLSVKVEEMERIIMDSVFGEECASDTLLCSEVFLGVYGVKALLMMTPSITPELLQDMLPGWSDEIEEFVQDS